MVKLIVASLVATFAHVDYLLAVALGLATAPTGNFWVDELEAIALTIVGWVFFFVGGVVGYLISGLLDFYSLFKKIEEISGGEVATVPTRIVSVADLGADTFDIGLSTYNICGAVNGHHC
jgi:hypothetical protein